MKVFARIDASCALAEVPDITRRIESLGYDGVHVSETIHDPFVVAALSISSSNDLVIRTSVALAFIRSPLLTAYSAWDLSKLSGGRFHLGLGSQIRQNIEDRYGMPWSSPVERMREYVDVLECAFAAFRTGNFVPFEGSHYRLQRLQKYFNPGPDDLTVTPPIWLGGVNERMTKLAGERASGFMTHTTNSHPKYIRERCVPSLSEGSRSVGRDPASIPIIAGSCFITARSTDEIMAKREAQRRRFAFLYSTPAYKTTLELLGYDDLSDKLRLMVRTENWDELESVVTDDVLDEVQPSAPFDELPDLVASRLSGLVSGFVLDIPLDASDDEQFRDTVKAIQTID